MQGACAPEHSKLAPRCVRSSTCACRSASASFLARPLGSSRSTGSKPQKRCMLRFNVTIPQRLTPKLLKPQLRNVFALHCHGPSQTDEACHGCAR